MASTWIVLFVVLAYSGLVHGNHEPCELAVVADETTQTLSTPHYPANYDNFISCAWTIIAGVPGGQVEVLFTRVLTETCCDYIVVRDGSSSQAAIVGNFRGNASNINFISTFGALYITFVSDDSITKSGFEFEYVMKVIDPETQCGDELMAHNDQQQSLSSPSFPFNYPDDLFCIWTITATESDQLILLSLIRFTTESCCDNLLIRDGVTETSPLLAYLRGRTIRILYFLTSGQVMHLRFRTDRSRNYQGFFAGYRSVQANRFPQTPELPFVDECGTSLETPASGHGNLTSPGFPGPHSSELMCAWVITAPTGRQIRVWFDYVSTERCCDWIKLRDGADPTSPKIGVISGSPSIFYNFVSTGNVIRIEFDSDSSQNSRGFSAFYEMYEPGADNTTSMCGGEYRADETLQYISTPNWPSPYDENTTCTWVISAGFEMNVQIRIIAAIIEVIFDHVSIYDGRSSESRRMARLSGKHYSDVTLTSTGPYLTVVFESDPTSNHGGFRASYTEVDAKPAVINGPAILPIDGGDAGPR